MESHIGGGSVLSTQVMIAASRAASSRPYMRNTFAPTVPAMFHAAPRPSSGSPRRASFPRGKLLYRAFAWYHSTAQVVFATWRAASSRPYMRNTFAPAVPTTFHAAPRPSSGSPSGEPASPKGSSCSVSGGAPLESYGVISGRSPERHAGRSLRFRRLVHFYPTHFKAGHVRRPENCQLSIVNCQFSHRSLRFR